MWIKIHLKCRYTIIHACICSFSIVKYVPYVEHLRQCKKKIYIARYFTWNCLLLFLIFFLSTIMCVYCSHFHNFYLDFLFCFVVRNLSRSWDFFVLFELFVMPLLSHMLFGTMCTIWNLLRIDTICLWFIFIFIIFAKVSLTCICIYSI